MRLLVVEDDPKILRAIKKGFEQEAFAVDTATDAAEAWGWLTTIAFDAVVLDRMLPGDEDGVDLCKKMRAEGIATPVLLLTARDAVKDRVEGLEAGADDYLVKPFAFVELLARIRALLRRPAETQNPVLTYDGLELHHLTRMAYRDGKTIKLTVKEYGLLDYFMRHPDRLLTKEMIMDHVWDFDADILPNTIEAYIGYLRNKIDRPFTGKKGMTPLIHTVRGFGYRFGKEV